MITDLTGQDLPQWMATAGRRIGAKQPCHFCLDLLVYEDR
jgi:hypothetical protein